MQQFLKEFFRDCLYQVLGWQRPRKGKLSLTHRAFLKMRQYQLDEATLENAFRFGVETPKRDYVEVIHTYPTMLSGCGMS